MTRPKAMLNTKRAAETVAAQDEDVAIKPLYLESRTLVERLHRRLLDVIKDEFDRMGRDDVNSVQALLLFNIGESELTAGELRTRGYYLGSNVSYNLKKLVEGGYVKHERSRLDRRSVRVSLTEKGQEIARVINRLYDRHIRSIEQVGGIGVADFRVLNKSLHRLERFWTDQILYRL
jgi:DNA-binding MarR family transcriptional regulator